MAGRRRPRGRAVDGILLLDKPAGLSSNAALQHVKRIYRAERAGHTGNLDPLATGLLVVCLGEATKISGWLLDANKRYLATCRLGARSTTGDAEGELIEPRPVPPLDAEQVDAVLARFTGRIEQVPPMYSALKQDGKPLYELARKGIEVERKVREVTIHSLRQTHLGGDEIGLDVHCSKGTYIRTLVEDIGEVIGCGGWLAALRRTEVGPFSLDNAVTAEQLQEVAGEGTDALDRLLLPIETAVADWPALELSENLCFYLRRGQPVQVAGAPTSGLLRLQGPGGKFLGIGEMLDDGRIAPRRLFHG